MAVLLAYNLASDFAASTVASNITGSIMTNASLSYFARDTLAYASDPILVANPPASTTSAALAITNGSYFFITITPTSGNSISLTTLTFNIARGGASTPRGYDVRSSVDSFAASLGTADVATARTTWTNVSIDLSAAGFQNVTGSITFNIYLYAPSEGNSLDIDDVVINGTDASSGTVQQEGFRWRSDDGSETAATWLATQDTDIIQEKATNVRLRVLLNSTLDRGSESYQLEYRKVGGTTWRVID